MEAGRREGERDKGKRGKEKFDVELTTLSLLIYRRYPSTLRALVRARSLARRPLLHSRAYILTNTFARVHTLSHSRARTESRSHPPAARVSRPPSPRLADPRSAGVFPPSPCFRGPFQPPRSTPCPAGHVPIRRRFAIVRSIASSFDLAAQPSPL